ncbi:MAG: Hsp33 family molecular chaperone HslO [Thermoanaerobaculia bacterium]|nr:Hsp33 family molecular chaperone HslO [Thermoanaerobaculia bacterium]
MSSAPSAPVGLPAGGRLDTGLACGGALRWVAAELTQPLEEARRRLDLSPIGAVALGRSLAGAALLQRISLKTPSRVILEVMGDGPLGKVIAESDERGRLRGMVGSPRLPTPEDGRMRIAPLVGRGMLRVTREGERRSYVSQVELVSGELGDDLTHYLEQSEQIRSAVLLGVLPRPAGIAAAGGLVVEALPGADEEVVDRLEENLRVLEGVSFHLERGGAGALTAAVLQGLDPEPRDSLPLEYRCRCSREKLLARLRPLATEDLPALVDGARECEAICAFCGARYLYTAAELLSED